MKSRRTATLVALLLLAATALLLVRPGEPGIRATRAALQALPPSARCGDFLGQWAAMVQGVAPIPPSGCPHELLRGRRTALLLAALAHDPAAPIPVRVTALRVLDDGDAGPPGAVDAVLAGPEASPALRRAALESLARGRRGADWAERARSIAIHGLYDRATFHLFAQGEPGMTYAALRALEAAPDDDQGSVLAGLGVEPPALLRAIERFRAGQADLGVPQEWGSAFHRAGCWEGDACERRLVSALLVAEAEARGEEPAPPQPPVGPADAAIDALHGIGSEAADHLREEIATVERWILAAPGSEPTRLASAILHAHAEPVPASQAPREAGDVHGALRRGGGMPGATALLVEELGSATGVETSLWVAPDGLVVRVGQTLLELRPCERIAPAHTVEGTELPPGGGIAIGLVEGVGAALRARDVDGAEARLVAAHAAWRVAPGLADAEASVLAARGPGAAGVDTLAERILGLSPSAKGRANAAWWAASAGHAELARRILPDPLSDEGDDVRVAAGILIGEPLTPVGPVSAAAAGRPWTGSPASCQHFLDVGPYPGSLPEAPGEGPHPVGVERP